MGLFKPFWMKENADEEKLILLAQKVKNLEVDKKIEAAKCAPMWQLRKAAIEGIEDQAVLSEIVAKESDSDVRRFALGKITDSSVLIKILEENAKAGIPTDRNREIINSIFECSNPEDRKMLFLNIPQYNRKHYIKHLSQEDICDVLILADSDNAVLTYSEHLFDHESMINAIIGICDRGWAYTRYGYEAIERMFKKLNEEERMSVIEKTKNAESAEKGNIIRIAYERFGMDKWH